MKAIRELLGGERGVSQVVAVILMIAVAIVLTSTVGLVVFDITGDSEEENVIVSVDTELDNGELVVRHSGGDTVDPEDLKIQVDSDSGTDVIDLENKLSDSFTAGTEFRLRPQSAAGDALVQLVHEPTNSILYDEERTAAPTVQLSSSSSVSGGNSISPTATVQKGFFGGSGSTNSYDSGVVGLSTQSGSSPTAIGTAQAGTSVEYRIDGATVKTKSINLPQGGGTKTVNFGTVTPSNYIKTAVPGSDSASVTQTVTVTGGVSASQSDTLRITDNSISNALSAVDPGGTVKIKDGSAPNDFTKSIKINTKDITVEGVGGTPTIVGQSQSVFDIRASGVTLSGLEVRNPKEKKTTGVGAIGVRVRSGLQDITVKNMRITDIDTDSGTKGNGRGIQVQKDIDGLEITDNTITNIEGRDRTVAIQVSQGGSGSPVKNLVIDGNTISDIRWDEKFGGEDSGKIALTRAIAINGDVRGDILNNEITNLRGEASTTRPIGIILTTGGSSQPRDIEISGNSFSDIGTNDPSEIIDTPASEIPGFSGPDQDLKFVSHITIAAFNNNKPDTLTIKNNDFTGKVGPTNNPALPDNTDVYVTSVDATTPFGTSFLSTVESQNSFNLPRAVAPQDSDLDGTNEQTAILPNP